MHLDTVALEKSVGRTGWPLGIDIGEGSIRTTEPSILARQRPGHFSASPVDLSKPGQTGQLLQEPYFVDAAGNVRPTATSPWGGLWTTAGHAAVEWSDRTSRGFPGDSHNVFHIVNPEADVTQALAGSQKISRTVWDEQELRMIEADRGVLPAVRHERPLIGDPTMIDVYGAKKLSPEADAALLKQFREEWTPGRKRRDPSGYQDALRDLRAERFKLRSRMADVLGIHRATYRTNEPISWLDAQRVNLEVMRSKLPGVTHRAGSDVTWNTDAPVVRLTGDQPQRLQSWLEANTTPDYRPDRQAVNRAVSAQSDADQVFRQLEYLAADSTDPTARQVRIDHLRQHIDYLESVDPGLRNPRSGFNRNRELSEANARLNAITASDASEKIASLRAQYDQAAVRATDARKALERTIAPDGTDLLGEYSPPSVRRYHQNAQPKALNWVVRNNPETGNVEVLMLRRGYGSEKGLNTPPGGIQDARMTGRETAVEEALEEAGLVTEPVFELKTPIGYNQTSVVSVVDYGVPVKVQRSEVQGYGWMSLEEVTPSNVAYPEYAMPQVRQLQQWAKSQTPDEFAAAAAASGNSSRPRREFSSAKPPDDGFGTVDLDDYGEELGEYGYRKTADEMIPPIPAGRLISAQQRTPRESEASADDAIGEEGQRDDSTHPQDMRDGRGDPAGARFGNIGGHPGMVLRSPTHQQSPVDRPYAPPTTPADTPYAPPTTPADTPYAPPTTPGDTPYAPPTTPADTPYAPPTSPVDLPYAPPTTPTDTPYAPPTSPVDLPYAPPTTPTDTPYAPPTTPTDTPYAPPTTPVDTPYAPPTTPIQRPQVTPGSPSYALPTHGLDASLTQPPARPDVQRRRRDNPDAEPRRVELANPVEGDPNLHPREVQYIEPVRHTVDLVTGEHTIEPLTDQQVRTAKITSLSPENPAGEIHVAGSVQLEVQKDRIVLESKDRHKNAGDPTDYLSLVPVNRTSATRTDPASLVPVNRQGNTGRTDPASMVPINRHANAVPTDPNSLVPVNRQGSSGRTDPASMQPRERENAVGKTDPKSLVARDQQGNAGGKTDPRSLTPLPGKGPARSGGRRSANNIDPSLMSGRGAMNRRGGGKRRRDRDEEDERRNRRPVVQVVLEN